MPIHYGFQPSAGQRRVLREMFIANLGHLPDTTLDALEQDCEWVACEGGEELFHEGEAGDSAYFLVAGRLRAIHIDASGKRHLLGDIEPGETVGEISILSNTPRNATVVAARDCTMVRVSAQHLQTWFDVYPRLLLKIARLVIKRAAPGTRQNRRVDHVTNIVFVPVTGQVDVPGLQEQLQAAIATYGSTLILDSRNIDRLRSGSVPDPGDAAPTDAEGELTRWLEEQERSHDFVIYITDRDAGAWTRRCLRRADRIVLLADPRDASKPSALEKELIEPTAGHLIANTFLAMLHPPDTVAPAGTTAWLTPRPWVSEAIHVRVGDDAHLARLVRLITGNAIGIVLGSGGARGLSHAGVFRAMAEAGIPVDRVGGTSIGAVMGAGLASGWDADQVHYNTLHSFGQNPTNLRDMSVPPLLSAYTGNRMRRLLDDFFAEPMAIEDLWINFFCVSCDISSNRESVHTRGPLRRSICASVALPGVFPPVRLGDGLHVDGAFMNALPVDIMGQLGAARIIAFDLGAARVRTFDFAETPSPFEYFYNKFFRRKKRRYNVPSVISGIVQSSLLASEAKAVQARIDADLVFHPDVHKFDIMEWGSCARLIEIGYQHARQLLATHPDTPALLAHIAGRAQPAPALAVMASSTATEAASVSM